MTGFIKAERVLMIVCFITMLLGCAWNIYYYLLKHGMYKSFPLVISYILITLFSLNNLVYETYMGFGCGAQDCLVHLFE